jgi:uncharacterized protein (DUF1810 family)
MTDSFDLQRVLDAQSSVYPRVLDELRRGRKKSHWMWFIFPELADLDTARWRSVLPSPRARRRSPISCMTSLEPGLGECTALINAVKGRTIMGILGSPDDLEFRSSMTLFGAVSSDREFAAAISKFYGGEPDKATLCLLAS